MKVLCELWHAGQRLFQNAILSSCPFSQKQAEASKFFFFKSSFLQIRKGQSSTWMFASRRLIKWLVIFSLISLSLPSCVSTDFMFREHKCQLCVFRNKSRGTHLIPLSKKQNHSASTQSCNPITCIGDEKGNHSVFFCLFFFFLTSSILENQLCCTWYPGPRSSDRAGDWNGTMLVGYRGRYFMASFSPYVFVDETICFVVTLNTSIQVRFRALSIVCFYHACGNSTFLVGLWKQDASTPLV